MLSTTSPDNDTNILNRLQHPEREHNKKRMTRNLFLRNILNCIFIIVALIAMIGILADKSHIMLWYAVGLFAVIIKMVEVMLRMPGIKKLR